MNIITSPFIGLMTLKNYQITRGYLGTDFHHLELHPMFFYPNMQTIFNDILHGNGTVFRQAIKYFIQLTKSFDQLVQHP